MAQDNRGPKFWLSIASLVISIAAATFSGLQWRNGRRAVESTERSARPYLEVSAHYQAVNEGKEAYPLVVYEVRAFGQTPALRVKMSSGCTVLSHIKFVNAGGLESPESFVKDINEIAGIYDLLPGQTVRYTCPIPEVTKLRAKGDIPEFVLRGRVDYGDMWRNSHYANFCFYQDLDRQLAGHCDKSNDSN